MTKRRCPWPLESCLQLKSHIGLREVANGVNGRAYMNSIEDYTNKLLYNGAKEVYSHSRMEVNPEINCSEKENLYDSSQTTITSYFPMTSKAKYFTSHKDATSACKQCREATRKCQFCSKSTCAACSRSCSNCNQQFCSSCSILNYDTDYDTALCFGCIK